jgi:hypothetical protein
MVVRNQHWLLQWPLDLPHQWPHAFALAFGVVSPVLLLICVALFFGFFLAELEASAEMDNNNQVIATRFELAAKTRFLDNVTGMNCIDVPLFREKLFGP